MQDPRVRKENLDQVGQQENEVQPALKDQKVSLVLPVFQVTK